MQSGDSAAAPKSRLFVRIMSPEEKVKSHTRCVEAGQAVRYCEACPRCGAAVRGFVHDCRPRTFRLIVEGCVKIFRSGIWRRQCLACRERFSDYSPWPCRTNAL